jgi:hypothetical protein
MKRCVSDQTTDEKNHVYNIYIYTHINYIHRHAHPRTHISLQVCEAANKLGRMKKLTKRSIYTYVCMYVYIYIYIYIRICVYIDMPTYPPISLQVCEAANELGRMKELTKRRFSGKQIPIEAYVLRKVDDHELVRFFLLCTCVCVCCEFLHVSMYPRYVHARVSKTCMYGSWAYISMCFGYTHVSTCNDIF